MRPTKQGHILVVDDTLPNLDLLRSMLAEHGFQTRGAPNGKTALRAARASPPELILLDINMPDLSGYEVCEALKKDERTQEIPVIFLSAAGEVLDKIKAFEVGGVDYITKPFHLEEVLVRVQNQLTLYRLQQELRQANTVLTEQKAQIELQAQRLMELDEAKSRFFVNISHEFRTPLTLILGRLEDTLEERYGPVTEQMAHELDSVRHGSHRLEFLIEQILDLSKLEAGVMLLCVQRTDLVAFLQSLKLTFASLAERKKITVTLDAPTAPIWAYFDHEALAKVFTNLLANAFSFTPSGGAIQIYVACDTQVGDEGIVQIKVEDEGGGIPEDALPHLFERFYQAPGPDTRARPGTGIGLALSKELVQLHGGDITVTSTVGEGSTFMVSLPLGQGFFRPDQVVEGETTTLKTSHDVYRTSRQVALSQEHAYVTSVQIQQEVQEERDEEADRTTVLIIDDNPEIRALVRRHLVEEYRVLEAVGGESGLALAQQTLPDLIVSDVAMDGMDGYALCTALKQDPELGAIPVILLTVEASSESRLKGLQVGADDYITKPFDMKELQARVHNLIEARQRLREQFVQTEQALPTGGQEILSADDLFLQRARAMVETHISDPEFNVEHMASLLAQDRTTLYRRLRTLVGQTSVEFIRAIRLKHAEKLLAARAGSVSEIAYAVGFKSLSYFSSMFAKQYGITPSKYMRVAEEPKASTRL